MKARKEDYLNYPWMYIVLPPTKLKELSPYLATGNGFISIATKLSYSHVIPHFVEFLRSHVPAEYKDEIKEADFLIINFYPFDEE